MALNIRSAKSILQISPHIRCVPYVSQISGDKHSQHFNAVLIYQMLQDKEKQNSRKQCKQQKDLPDFLHISTDVVSLFTKDLRSICDNSRKSTGHVSTAKQHQPCRLARSPSYNITETSDILSLDPLFSNIDCFVDSRSLLSDKDLSLINKKVTSSGMTLYQDWTKLKLETPNKETSSNPKKPPNEHLVKVKEFLITTANTFFRKTHTYYMYHKDVILENNFFGKNNVTNGINSYAVQMMKLRVMAHCSLAQVEMSIIKITVHPEDNTVRVNWRVYGLPQLRALKFWKFNPWTFKKAMKEESIFYDGFSTFHVGADGLIHKHRIDKVMPDQEVEERKDQSLAFKLALIFGLVPRSGLQDFSGLFFKKRTERTPIII